MKQVFVLGIDGLPHSLLKALSAIHELPNLSALAASADFRQMDSVIPCVSAAAWVSFITGKHPGKHGIYGFVDRAKDSYDVTIPSSESISARNIWQILSDAGRRVFGMNVPITYPPMPVNGIIISDFLCPSLDKVALRGVREWLKAHDYRIDSDPTLARRSPDLFLRDVEITLKRRGEAILHFLAEERWDYFHAHIMETDRLFHFLFSRLEGRAYEILRQVDDLVGLIVAQVPPEAGLIIVSDHGFAPVKAEVQLSRYLVEKGWTTPASLRPRHPLDIDPTRSRAYTLIPGRIHLNLRGREPAGIVAPEDREAALAEIERDLLALRSPGGDQVIERVFRRETLYPVVTDKIRAPDLVAVAREGYDLKMGIGSADIFTRTELDGMHTFSDAILISRGVKLPEGRPAINRIARAMLETMGVPPPGDMD